MTLSGFSDSLSQLLLISLVALLPFMWLPGVAPKTIWVTKLVVVSGYLVSRGAFHMLGEKVRLPSNYFIAFPTLFGLFFIVNLGPQSSILALVLGYVATAHALHDREPFERALKIFVVLWAVLATYALLITYLPIYGFEPTTYTGGVPYSAYFRKTIKPNSFAFYHRNLSVAPLSIAAILCFGLLNETENYGRFYVVGLCVLLLQLVNVIVVSGGHGRAGLVMVLFAVCMILLTRLGWENLIPIIVVSPFIGIVTLYAYVHFFGAPSFVYPLDEFMSGRISVFFQTIDVVLANFTDLTGIGPYRFYDLKLRDVGVSPNREFVFRSYVIKPHNFLLKVFISQGVVAGALMFIWLFAIGRWAKILVAPRTFGFRWSVATVLTGSIFTGLSVGKYGPFPALDNDMLFWWLGYSLFLAYLYSDVVNKEISDSVPANK